ncbi:MAG: heme-binding domain-containing protein [Planctomycetes bacterium]|nr:heme-binding domain-containing protein [Planctomycetota bacterium]
MKLILKRIGYGLLVLFGLIQLWPYGRDHEAPPGNVEPQWDSPRTRELALRACFDCHSNLTEWPWYSRVAPVSWLVQHDVDEGREHLNFSLFDRTQRHAEDCADELLSGEMPLSPYVWLHPKARLSPAEKDELAAGFDRTFGEH